MDRTFVVSSNIESIGYDEGTMTLEIEFKEGRIYQYFDVPVREYEEFIGSESKGKYFNQFVRNRYRETRL